MYRPIIKICTFLTINFRTAQLAEKSPTKNVQLIPLVISIPCDDSMSGVLAIF